MVLKTAIEVKQGFTKLDQFYIEFSKKEKKTQKRKRLRKQKRLQKKETKQDDSELKTCCDVSISCIKNILCYQPTKGQIFIFVFPLRLTKMKNVHVIWSKK